MMPAMGGKRQTDTGQDVPVTAGPTHISTSRPLGCLATGMYLSPFPLPALGFSDSVSQTLIEMAEGMEANAARLEGAESEGLKQP